MMISAELKKKCWLARSYQIDGKCHRCSSDIDVFDYRAVRVFALKFGGTDELNNIVPVCSTVCAEPSLILSNTPSVKFVYTNDSAAESAECVIMKKTNGYIVYYSCDSGVVNHYNIYYKNNHISVNRYQLCEAAKYIKSRNPEPIMLGNVEISIGRDGNTQVKFEDGSTIWGPTDNELLDKLIRL